LDADTSGSTSEVQADATVRSTGTDPRSAAIRQQSEMRRTSPDPTYSGRRF
jgi:hypothetical protein